MENALSVLCEIPFHVDFKERYFIEIGNGIASASAFPNGVWERGGLFITL
jgi:hypothetical protein